MTFHQSGGITYNGRSEVSQVTVEGMLNLLYASASLPSTYSQQRTRAQNNPNNGGGGIVSVWENWHPKIFELLGQKSCRKGGRVELAAYNVLK